MAPFRAAAPEPPGVGVLLRGDQEAHVAPVDEAMGHFGTPPDVLAHKGFQPEVPVGRPDPPNV